MASRGLRRSGLRVTPQDPLEIEMESKLSPRDIQTRIRAGETLEEVARAAGVPAEQIEVFAAPVIAEREHVAGAALAAPVRRTGESSSTRGLRAVVAQRLEQRGIDPETVEWDAWREPDRRWTVRARYESGSNPHEATFSYDARARFSVARDEEARWLIGEHSQAHGPQPGRKPRDPDAEPTIDLNDELALVRAVQPNIEDAVDLAPVAQAAQDESSDAAEDRTDQHGSDPADYQEADLQEVDGVYDLVVGHSDLDVLYEMLSGFDEDSVNIYSGLTQPVVDEIMASPEPPTLEAVQQAVLDTPDDSEGLPEDQRVVEDTTDDPLPGAEGVEPEPETVEQDARDEELAHVQASEPEEQPQVEGTDEDADEVASSPTHVPLPPDAATDAIVEEAEAPEATPAATAQAEEAAITEPEQDPLLGDDEVPTQHAPKPKPRKKGRASVPSWDEIMFGSPKR